MDIQIFTRASRTQLYELSGEFLPVNIERIACDNFLQMPDDANNYLHHIINTGREWVINLDDDAFITDWQTVLNIIQFMDDNGYEYAGMPDGGVCHHRFHSWVVCNPFFNIFNASVIRQKMKSSNRFIIDNFKYESWMEQYRPSFVTGTYCNDYFEPFNSLFYWLMSCSKGLYLSEKSHADSLSSLLQWRGKTFIYHSWYAREFSRSQFHHDRIQSLYCEAKGVMIPLHQ